MSFLQSLEPWESKLFEDLKFDDNIDAYTLMNALQSSPVTLGVSDGSVIDDYSSFAWVVSLQNEFRPCIWFPT